ncbi:hypothetical protein C355_05924 [Cryptococcus neoformans Th84]|nr:hypothetical protein C355_05924 [Cryptococcus neoformans var. grubii Th84]
MPVGVGVRMLQEIGRFRHLSRARGECETNTSTAFEGVQQAIIAYLMEEEVLEVRRQEMRGRFQEELLVALGISRKRKRGDRDDSSEE